MIPTQRDLLAGIVAKHYARQHLLPRDVVQAHERGDIHYHDLDYSPFFPMFNCMLIDLKGMLTQGFKMGNAEIEPPKSISTATAVTAQIIAQVASHIYGGTTINRIDEVLAPFVTASYNKHRKTAEEWNIPDAEGYANSRTIKECYDAFQSLEYEVNTLHTANGQTPFVTFGFGLGTSWESRLIQESILRNRIAGLGKNRKTAVFPKLVFAIRDGLNHKKGDPNYDIKQLALECASKRMYPDILNYDQVVKVTGSFKTPMGCRSFLTPDRSGNGYGNVARAKNYEPGRPKYYGRFNQGVVTINLPDVALSSHQDMDEFWKIFDERLELCHRALRCRHERLLGTLSDAAPILWQYGALARLDKGETIDKLLYGGYSTISLGYAGLYECVKYMTGASHTDEAGTPFAMAVMQRMNDKCNEWKAAEDIDYSIYGTPLESTTYKFAKCLQRRFGVVPGVTDKGYITNSYHVHVTEEIDAFDKLKFESQFQRLSPGGAISYVEVPNMQDNLKAVIRVMQYIYDNIMYAELNTKSDYCQECGYDGEIRIVEDDGKLVWECPKCGNRDQEKLNVARRTCGYIGTQFWNQGRTEEIRDRVLHL